MHFRLELSFKLLDMTVRERTVARGVGMYLGAVEADGAQLEQLHFSGKRQYLHEQPRQFIEETPAEACQRVMVGMGARRKIAKSN